MSRGHVIVTLGFCLSLPVQALAADPPAKEKKWAGTEIGLRHAASLLTFAPDSEPSYDPLVIQTISVDPVWRIHERVRLLGHLGLDTELTDSNVTTDQREPLLDDFFVQASTPFKLPKAIDLSVHLRLTLPTSREARARQRLFTAAPGVTAARAFPTRWAGDVTLRPSLTLRGAWIAATSTSLVYDAPSITTCDAARESCEEFDHAGDRSAAATLTEVAGVSAEWPFGLSVNLQIWWVQTRLHGLDELVGPDGMPVESSDDNTNWRFANLYLIGAEYPLDTAWGRFKLGGGFQTVNPELAPDSSRYRPFLNRYTQVYVTTSYVF